MTAPIRLNVFAVRALLVALVALATSGCAMNLPEEDSSFERVKVTGDQVKNGIFDPAVEYGDDGVGWLAYSQIEAPKLIHTHLATSADRGKTWSFVTKINESYEDTIEVDGKPVRGAWRYETPTLVHDPGDPGKQWKLFSIRYFVTPPFKGPDRLFSDGWIAYKYASNPTGPWSKEIRLFGPPSSGAEVNLSTLDPKLRKFAFFSEPGSVVVGDEIFMSFDAYPTKSGLGDWENHQIVLVSSADHGATWRFRGILTGYADCKRAGYAAFTASSLVEVDGRHYLLVSPAGSMTKAGKGHDGTYIIAFEDIARAKLHRDADGHLVILKHIRSNSPDGGESDYDEHNTYGGIVYPAMNPRAFPEVAQVYSTREWIDSE